MAILLSSEEGEKYCILIIGHTGSGKSSTGNTILGNLVFPVAKGLKTETRKAKAHTVGNLTVIDTPTITLEMTDEDAEVESREWLKEAGLKPNAIVLTINCKNRFTPEEYKLYCRYKSLFRNTIEFKLLVVFTRGDLITPEEPFNPSEVDNLQKIINDARERYFIYNNKTKDYAKENENLLKVLKAISKKSEKEKDEDLQECENRMLSMEDGSTKSDMSTPRKGRKVLLVIGKSGTGKSSTGNTILGSRCFKTSRGFKTQTCEAQVCFNDEFEIIDTPDIPLNMSRKQAEEEVGRWLEMASAIPNAVLFTINADEDYSHEDLEIFERLTTLLDHWKVCENIVIVFTRGDLIDRLDIEQLLIHDKGDPISVVLKAACGRYVIFDNNTKDAHKKIEQLKTLSEKIELSRHLPKKRSLKEREQEADSVLTQPVTTCRKAERTVAPNSQQTACQCTPSLNAESATYSSSKEEEIRVLVMGAQHEARDKVYASLRRKTCDREDWFGRTEAESRIFKVINCTLPLDGPDTPESELEYQTILLCSKPGPHAILLVVAMDENFKNVNYKAIECFVSMFGKRVKNFLLIVLVYSESSGVNDETCTRARINKRLQSASPYLSQILKMKNDEYLPFNVTNKPDVMNNEVCNAFQWILSTVKANNGRFFDNDEANILIQNPNKNTSERMVTELTSKKLSSDSSKSVQKLHRIEHSQKKEPKTANVTNIYCHIL